MYAAPPPRKGGMGMMILIGVILLVLVLAYVFRGHIMMFMIARELKGMSNKDKAKVEDLAKMKNYTVFSNKEIKDTFDKPISRMSGSLVYLSKRGLEKCDNTGEGRLATSSCVLNEYANGSQRNWTLDSACKFYENPNEHLAEVQGSNVIMRKGLKEICTKRISAPAKPVVSYAPAPPVTPTVLGARPRPFWASDPQRADRLSAIFGKISDIKKIPVPPTPRPDILIKDEPVEEMDL